MYLNGVSYYVPEKIVTNAYFSKLNGLSEDWIEERTGIRSRRKASSHENTNTMAIEAVKSCLDKTQFPAEKIDLIVGGTYTPHDTIVTLGHAVQKYLNIPDIPVTSVSSACSTFLNAMEIVQGYFALNKAQHAIVVVSEHNTAYNNDKDTVAGHLWGDGAAAVIVSKEPFGNQSIKVLDVLTGGAATAGMGTEGVMLKPVKEGICMPHGRDVFTNACHYMPKATTSILERNGYTIDDLTYLIPHQANYRITKRVAKQLEIDESMALSNVEYLGNTGCAGCAIALAEHWESYHSNDLMVIAVFGGGYSYGAMLLQPV